MGRGRSLNSGAGIGFLLLLKLRSVRAERYQRALARSRAGTCKNPRAMDARRVANLRPFAALSPARQGMLARMRDEVRARGGATLGTGGDYGYEFMVIEGGTVDVFRGGGRVDARGRGVFFG